MNMVDKMTAHFWENKPIENEDNSGVISEFNVIISSTASQANKLKNIRELIEKNKLKNINYGKS